MLRRLVISLVVLVAVLIAADRIAAVVAEHEVASRVQASESLTARPGVSIGGFPFLTQALSGRYDDVTVSVHGLRAGSLPIQRFVAHLRGLHVSLRAALGGRVHSVPVDRATATLLLTWADLDALLRQNGAVADVNGSLVRSAGVSGAAVVLHTTAAGDIAVPLRKLPFGVRLTSATRTAAGVDVHAAATSFVLHP
jgi:hypothetical protein